MGCDGRLKIDLHIHSTASDGSLQPAQIVEQAITYKLAAISITDHDTIEGARQALEHGIPASLQFLTGVEISSNPPAAFPFAGSLHILGYGMQLDDVALNETLTQLQSARKNRNPQILKLLDRMGIHISLDEVRAEVGDGQLGRPHIARLMVARGVVGSMDEAFTSYLGKGKPAYVDKYRVDCGLAIQLIRQAGGVAVLAHPGLLQADNSAGIEDLLVDLKAKGLGGIEVLYTGHNKAQTKEYMLLAEKYNLLITGGSDFHGTMFSEVQMGSGTGDLNIPYSLYEKLANHIQHPPS